MVKVRLFAALRELASASQVEAEGRTAGDVVDALSARFGDRFAQIAAVGSLVVNGDRATRSTVLADGDELAVLPPVSGGCEQERPVWAILASSCAFTASS